MWSPFYDQESGYTYATDGRLIVRTKGRVDHTDIYNCAAARELFAPINADELQAELYPVIPPVKAPQYQECSECDGKGCEACEGEGKIDVSPIEYMRIFGFNYSLEYLNRIRALPQLRFEKALYCALAPQETDGKMLYVFSRPSCYEFLLMPVREAGCELINVVAVAYSPELVKGGCAHG